MWPVLFHPNTGKVVPGMALHGFVSLHWDTACRAQEHVKSWSRSKVSGRGWKPGLQRVIFLAAIFPTAHWEVVPDCFSTAFWGSWLNGAVRLTVKHDQYQTGGMGQIFCSSQMPLLISARMKAEAETDESKQHRRGQRAEEIDTWQLEQSDKKKTDIQEGQTRRQSINPGAQWVTGKLQKNSGVYIK